MNDRLIALKSTFRNFSSKEAIGMAFLRVWSTSFFSSALVFGSFSNAAGWGTIAHNISLLAFMATFLVIGFAHRTPFVKRLLPHHKSAAFLVVAGSVCILVAVAVPDAPTGLVAIGGIIAGIGSASMSVSWGAAFASCGADVAYGTTVGMYMFTCLFALAFSACTLPILMVFALVSPVVSLIYLRGSQAPDWHFETDGDFPSEEKSRFVGFLFYIVLTSIVIGAVGAYCNENDPLGLDVTCVVVFGIVVFSAIAVMIFKKIDIRGVLTGTSLVLALFLLLLPLFKGSPFIIVVGLAGKTHGWIVIWTFIVCECIRSRKSPALYVGMGMGAHYAGFFIGQVLLGLLPETSPEFSAFVFSLTCMFLIVISYLVAMMTLSQRGGILAGNVNDDGANRLNEEVHPFDRKVALVSDYFGLTEREQEIMWHLAKGYSSKAIQSKLFISASTVSAHSSNIYRKMNVHSKEEVGEIVRSWDDATSANSASQNKSE